MFELWFAIVAVMFTAYVVLDGYDLGAGAIHLFVARTGDERAFDWAWSNIHADERQFTYSLIKLRPTMNASCDRHTLFSQQSGSSGPQFLRRPKGATHHS